MTQGSRILICLSLITLLLSLNVYILSVLAPFIKTDLNLTDTQLGLVASAPMLSFTIAAIPAGRWADRTARKWMIGVSIIVSGIITALSGFAQTLFQLLSTRLAYGISTTGYNASAAMVCDVFNVDKRPAVFATITVVAGVGGAVGSSLMALLGPALDWRQTLTAVGLLMIVPATLLLLTVREPERGAFDLQKDQTEQAPLRQVFTGLWRCNTYRMIIYVSITASTVYPGLAFWWPTFLSRQHGVSAAEIGATLGWSLTIGATAGVAVGGTVSSWLTRRAANLALLATAGANAAALLCVLGVILTPTLGLAYALIAGIAFTTSFGVGPYLSAAYSVVPANTRATSASLFALSGSLPGAASPVLIGALTDALNTEFGNGALQISLLTLTPILVIIVYCLLSASRSLEQDMHNIANPIMEPL